MSDVSDVPPVAGGGVSSQGSGSGVPSASPLLSSSSSVQSQLSGLVSFQSERQLLYSLCPPDDSAGGRRKCRHCTATYCPSSTSNPLLYHFQTEHKDLWAGYSAALKASKASKATKRDFNQKTLVEVLDGKALNDGFQEVVSAFIAHPGLPLSLADCPIYRRTLKYPQGVTSKSIRDGIIARDGEVLQRLRRLLHSKVVGLQVDGGKTVSHTKVLGLGFTLQGNFHCWKVVKMPPGVVWDSAFYCNLIRETIREIEACGAFVVSVTADNEASLSGGIELLQQEMKHLIHIRCFCHTCELMISDLQKENEPAIPMLQSVGDACKDLVTLVTNNKYLTSTLQRVQGPKALVLKKPSNTRKWSSTFLVCSRVLKLYSYLDELENHICVGPMIPHPPPQPHLLAKREWSEAKSRLLPNKLHLEAVVHLLYWIYVAEQVLQRDVSSIIHAAALFESLCECLGQMVGSSRVRPVPALIQQNMDATAVATACMTRRETLKRTSVHMLALFLWPKQVVEAENHSSAARELKSFVANSWAAWQAAPDNVELPADSRVVDRMNPEEMRQGQEAFTVACVRELSLYMGNSNDIKHARDVFLAECNAAVAHQESTAAGVKRGRTSSRSSTLLNFWLAIAPEVPHLFVVVKLLLATCAAESAIERMFSKEGFIHNKTRNRLQHDFTEALVRCCINSQSLAGNFAWLLDELYDDDNDDEMDADA